ncbi:hypothetical protein EI981_05010 [Paenibacillus lutimineralis]|uniref:Uncharacterized protein n=1 Tax=Paenibacillus lutimineralis TaxID=2707005 RepID=A0A3Q9I957_9BACL|nr:hypothetical protein EI981_05010 [Paenibacillus lutimineralis]
MLNLEAALQSRIRGSIAKMLVLGMLKLLPIISNETGYRYLDLKELLQILTKLDVAIDAK